MKLAKILFRCDVSNEIGFGHMKRCLNLAYWLRGKYEVAFVTQKTKEAQDILKHTEFEVFFLKKDATGEEVHERMRALCAEWLPKVVVTDVKDTIPEYVTVMETAKVRTVHFDDLGKGGEAADVLIDANRRENKKKFFGPRYVVLHAEYAKQHKKQRQLHKQVKNILVAIGGGDPHNYTDRILECLCKIGNGFNIVAVIGPTAAHGSELKKKWKNHEHVCFLEYADTLVKPLLWADCAIVNGGITMFEALCLGTPTLTVAQNEDEVKNIKRLERKNALLDIGPGAKVSVNKLTKRLKKMCDDGDYRAKVSSNAKETVDGQGIFRVLGVIERHARKR